MKNIQSMEKVNMRVEKAIKAETDFASAEKLDYEELLKQHQAWADQITTTLICNAVPDLLLILNKYRQIVYANEYFEIKNNFGSSQDYLGLRPGELMKCQNASTSKSGCGTSRLCSLCGVVNAILRSLKGDKDIEECQIERGDGKPPLELRVMTTPVELNQEKFIIFTFQDISIEKENARLLDEVQKLAILDPLTDIYNRRIFFDLANREIIRSMRYHNPFSVVMVDLDRFKEVNDTYGHPAGDAVIKEVVRLIQLNLREIDTFARYGGDEFIILLPETGQVGGQKLADRIMKRGDSTVYLFKDFEIPISFSAGVAEFQFELDHDIDDVVSRADQELFRVKRERKSQLRI